MKTGHQVSAATRLRKYALGTVFVASVTTLSWFNLAAAIVAICAVILVALQSKAGSLIEFSFGPLRAKLERELSEAEKLVEKLRAFAAIQAKMVITASSRTGRWADQTDDWQFMNMKRLDAALRDMGVSEAELQDARSELVKMTILDLGNSALGLSKVPTKLGPQAVAEWQAIKRSQLHSSPDEVEAYLRKWDSLSPERQLRIDDMRWIIENRDIRDREQFMRAHDDLELG